MDSSRHESRMANTITQTHVVNVPWLRHVVMDLFDEFDIVWVVCQRQGDVDGVRGLNWNSGRERVISKHTHGTTSTHNRRPHRLVAPLQTLDSWLQTRTRMQMAGIRHHLHHLETTIGTKVPTPKPATAHGKPCKLKGQLSGGVATCKLPDSTL